MKLVVKNGKGSSHSFELKDDGVGEKITIMNEDKLEIRGTGKEPLNFLLTFEGLPGLPMNDPMLNIESTDDRTKARVPRRKPITIGVHNGKGPVVISSETGSSMYLQITFAVPRKRTARLADEYLYPDYNDSTR